MKTREKIRIGSKKKDGYQQKKCESKWKNENLISVKY